MWFFDSFKNLFHLECVALLVLGWIDKIRRLSSAIFVWRAKNSERVN